MKIIIANRFYFPDESATSRMVTSLARSLVRQGARVHIVASDAHHDSPRREPTEAVQDGVAVHRVRSTALGRHRIWRRALDYLTFHFGAARRVRALAEPGDVVIVCTDPPLLSVSLLGALWHRDAVMVNWLHDLFPEAAIQLGVLRRGIAAKLLVRLRNLSLRAARTSVAPMPRMAEFLAQSGIPGDRLEVIRHWSDGREIHPVARETNALRRDWGLEGKFVVGYSGNFGRVHEFGTILDAAERLRADPRITFLFIGSGHRRAWFESEVSRRGLSNVIMKPLQPRDRLAESLGAADVHLISLLPDLETCSVPSKLYGILAAGRPVLFVGDRDGEVATVVRNGGCGASVAVGDPAALAERILALAGDETVRRTMGDAARHLFETDYVEAAGVANWHRLLRRLGVTEAAAASRAEGADARV